MEVEKVSFDDSSRDSLGDSLLLEKPLDTASWEQRSPRAPVSWSLLFHILTLLAYGIIFVSIPTPQVFTNSAVEDFNLIKSPARSAVQGKLQVIDSEEWSIFNSYPSPEQDRAWKDLLAPGYVIVQEEDLKAIGQSSIALKDGRGYLAQLQSYSDLECVDVTRRHVHRDYFGNSVATPEQSRRFDECINQLRESVMCHADLGINTYIWSSIRLKPWPVFEVEYECRDWDAIAHWAEDRGFRTASPFLLRLPDIDGHFHPK